MDEILINNKFLKLLTNLELQILKQYWLIKEYKPNDIILKQGKPGTGLFLIDKGEVTVTANFPGSKNYVFGQLQREDFFGEVTLLDDGPVTASVIATKDTRCFFLARDILTSLRVIFPELAHKLISAITIYSIERLRSIFVTLPGLLKNVKPKYRNAFVHKSHKTLREKKLLELATKVDLPNNKDLQIFSAFEDFSSHEIDIVKHHVSQVIVKGNTLLYEQADYVSNLFFILEGSSQLAYEVEGMQIKLDVKGPGNFISTLPYFDDEDEGLSCIVREYAKLLIIPYKELDHIKETNIIIYYKLFHHLSVSIVALIRDVNKQLLRIKCELEISIM